MTMDGMVRRRRRKKEKKREREKDEDMIIVDKDDTNNPPFLSILGRSRAGPAGVPSVSLMEE